MLKRLLVACLLAGIVVNANGTEIPDSRFVAQMKLAFSKVTLTDEGGTFKGNGDFLLQFGREFRFAKYFSWTPVFGINRNGWSFERMGYSGSITYIDLYIGASVNAHPFNVGYVDVGFRVGRPTFCFGELNGRKSTGEDSYFATQSIGFFSHVGADFLNHFRAGLEGSVLYMVPEDYPQMNVVSLGGFVSYMF